MMSFRIWAWSGSSSSTTVRPPRETCSRRRISSTVSGVGVALSISEDTLGSRRMVLTSAWRVTQYPCSSSDRWMGSSARRRAYWS